jgi:hypothetical protein
MLMSGRFADDMLYLGKEVFGRFSLDEIGVDACFRAKRRIVVVGKHQDRGFRLQALKRAGSARVVVFQRLIEHYGVNLVINHCA